MKFDRQRLAAVALILGTVLAAGCGKKKGAAANASPSRAAAGLAASAARVPDAYRDLKPGQVFVLRSFMKTKTAAMAQELSVETTKEFRLDAIDLSSRRLTYTESSESSSWLGRRGRTVKRDSAAQKPLTVEIPVQVPALPDAPKPKIERIDAEYEGGTMPLDCVRTVETIGRRHTVERCFSANARSVKMPWGTGTKTLRLSFSKIVEKFPDPGDPAKTSRTVGQLWVSDDLPGFSSTVWIHLVRKGAITDDSVTRLEKVLDPAAR